jgi:hypothetical protein
MKERRESEKERGELRQRVREGRERRRKEKGS